MSIFSRNDRVIAKHTKAVKSIQKDIDALSAMTDAELKNAFQELKKECEKKGFYFVRNKALALASSAMIKATGLRPFNVQLIGALVLLDAGIAEMRTGEGKTLTATLAVIARSIEGKGAHVVTVNDYLVRRDSEQTAKIAHVLGQSVGLVYSGQAIDEKKNAYSSDITYATNTELGFDFLRNNMTGFEHKPFMRDLYFVVVDEIDSILIDEARTPLIISEPDPQNDDLFREIDLVARKLKKGDTLDRSASHLKGEQGVSMKNIKEAFGGAGLDETGDFVVNEKEQTVHLTEEGFAQIEHILQEDGFLKKDDSLYAAHNLELVYHIEAALKAHHLYRNNVHYIIREGAILIVDEHTGRVLPGRRWGRGLHQAIEAKEGVSVQEETRVAASITLQNLFREYSLLSGMTGTATSEAGEFASIYNLEVIVIPTHRPMIRKDGHDQVFLTKNAKNKAVLEDIQERHHLGQPVLVGTTDVEASENLSALLQEHGIRHEVLNAKQHEKEAHIIAQAGRKGGVTIATNMAGRGTDIILGGNLEEIQALYADMSKEDVLEMWKKEHEEVVRLGGLHVIGTERHESRRIDDQLRGRAGRQGDPGSSRFYVSFDDDLMRIFGGGWAKDTLRVMGMGDKAIESGIVSRQLEKAQRAIETQNFNARKQLLDFDDVSNEQRQKLYEWRKWIQIKDNQEDFLHALVGDWLDRKIRDEFGIMLSEKSDEDMETSIRAIFPFAKVHARHDTTEDLYDDIFEQIWGYIQENDLVSWACQRALIATDSLWREHLVTLENIRKGIHLRGYAQKQPKQEYKKEAYELFKHMLQNADNLTLQDIFAREKELRNEKEAKRAHAEHLRQRKETATKILALPWGIFKGTQDILHGRMEKCMCGSGYFYKNCCGALTDENNDASFHLVPGVYTQHITYNGKNLPEANLFSKSFKKYAPWGARGINY